MNKSIHRRRDSWFADNQKVLLAMANTTFGRELLSIPNLPYPVIEIEQSHVRYLKSVKGDLAECVSDFRIGAYWNRIVRQRWHEINSYSRYFAHGQDYSLPMSPLTKLILAFSASTLTVFPDANPETTTSDARVTNNASPWSTCRSAASGSEVPDMAEPYGYCYAQPFSGFLCTRWFGTFDTSPLGAAATVSAAVLSLFVDTKWGSNYVTLYGSTTQASNTVLTAADFDQYGTTAFSSDITSFATGNYCDFTANAPGIASVALTGITKWGLREYHDVANDSPGVINGIRFESSENTNPPKLIVTYTTPVTLLGIERTMMRGVSRGVLRP